MLSRATFATALALIAAFVPAMADDYPDHPIKIVSPYPPGGTTDILARLLVPKLTAALVKKTPGKYAFASAGSGSPQHLAGEMLKIAYGLDLLHVPYKGSGPAISDVVGGQVPVGFESTVVLQPFVDGNRVRPLATTGAKRSISLPNVPTMMESGATDFDLTNWYGLFAPAGTANEFAQFIKAEVPRWAAVVKKSNAKVD